MREQHTTMQLQLFDTITNTKTNHSSATQIGLLERREKKKEGEKCEEQQAATSSHKYALCNKKKENKNERSHEGN